MLGLLAALRRRGLKIQPFKVGPDFIDPSHHTAITGTPSRTLDGWMLSRAYNEQTFWRHLHGQDLGLVEGMMGLFDGAHGATEVGSTAEMAKWLRVPVVLVVDASAMARSVAALLHGFRTFDPALHVAGVIFNRIGGPGHLRYLQDAVAGVSGLTVLGGLPQAADVRLPERHLGLVTPDEQPLHSHQLEQLATLVEGHIDLAQFLQLAQLPPSVAEPSAVQKCSTATSSPARVRFGVARDAAFCFYYADNLDLLEQAGADLVFFSPLHDQHLPPNLQGLYLGGGYPEVHAQTLAANTSMRQDIRNFVEQNGVVYAECGGLMYLTRGLRAADGQVLPFVGVYPTVVRMLPHLKALGYVEVTSDSAIDPFPSGSARGHVFHYSELEEEACWGDAITPPYRIQPSNGAETQPGGYRYKQCLASYVHLHFGSHPAWATSLVATARKRSKTSHPFNLDPSSPRDDTTSGFDERNR
jgi:cobyrinic acid a,c-diamide synthase